MWDDDCRKKCDVMCLKCMKKRCPKREMKNRLEEQ